MAEVAFHKVAVLPGVLEVNAFYLVENGDYAETYVTDSTGEARAVGNTAMIQAIAPVADTLQIVADIAARDALTPASNIFVLVQDASDDPTVATGAALYVWDNVGADWIKVTEYESLDVVVAWSSITGKPSSSVADIDDAVTKKHAHANMSTLNGLSDSAGVLQYGGNPVDARKIDWDTLNW